MESCCMRPFVSGSFHIAYVFKGHMYCSTYRYFIPFYGWTMFHCIDDSHFWEVQIYLVSSTFSCNLYPYSPTPPLWEKQTKNTTVFTASVFSTTIPYIGALRLQTQSFFCNLKSVASSWSTCVISQWALLLIPSLGDSLDIWIQLDEVIQWNFKAIYSGRFLERIVISKKFRLNLQKVNLTSGLGYRF